MVNDFNKIFGDVVLEAFQQPINVERKSIKNHNKSRAYHIEENVTVLALTFVSRHSCNINLQNAMQLGTFVLSHFLIPQVLLTLLDIFWFIIPEIHNLL